MNQSTDAGPVVLVEPADAAGAVVRTEKCPWCGDRHLYGNPEGGDPGSRVNHCPDPRAPRVVPFTSMLPPSGCWERAVQHPLRPACPPMAERRYTGPNTFHVDMAARGGVAMAPRSRTRVAALAFGRGRLPSGLCLLVVIAAVAAGSSSSLAQTAEPAPGTGAVYVVTISGTIDLGLAPYLDRVLDEAAEDGAAAVLLEIDTPGGRLDAVLEMRDSLLDSTVPTIAFVDRTAFSAGALIAIATERIYMTPAAVLGAATPVDGGTGETASPKVVSAVRKTFKATAEARGLDPIVAEAMVDPDVSIDGLVARGELLTLTTNEALANGYAQGKAADRAALLTASGLTNRPIVETSPGLAERVVRFTTSPIVASLLLILALLLIVGDFFVEGFGIVGVVGLGLLALFFWGHYLVGLAGWEDIALVVVGLVLLGAEVFVVPGFGVAGVLGLAALLGGLFLAMLGREITTPAGIERAGLTVAAALVAVVVGLVAGLSFLPRNRRLTALVLQANLGGADATISPAGGGSPRPWLRWFGGGEPLQRETVPRRGLPLAGVKTADRSLTGATGRALSDLHPGGIADIDGNQVDVVTGGDYIAAGEPIEVVRDERYRRVVRRIDR